jgi:hypothetical protein
MRSDIEALQRLDKASVRSPDFRQAVITRNPCKGSMNSKPYVLQGFPLLPGLDSNQQPSG